MMRHHVRDLASRLTGHRREQEQAQSEAVPCLPCQKKQGVRQFSLNESPPPVPDGFVPVIRGEMAYTVLDGQVVLHDAERDVSHVLNPGAAIVWSSIDDHLATAELVAQIARATGEAVETIDRDVRMALASFIAAGIVLPQQPSQPLGEVATEADMEAGAVKQEVARVAKNARDATNRGRVARALEQRVWCPDVGPRQVGGTSVLVRSNHAGVAEHLAKVLQCLPAVDVAESTISAVDRGGDGAQRFRIIVDDEIRVRHPSAPEAADSVLTQLNLLAIANTPGKLLFHGGAVERDGQVVAVLGVSGQGKSTLTAALVARGWDYLTDELVIVDPTTYAVDPYPKALDLSEESLDLLDAVRPLPSYATGKLQACPADLGSVSVGGRLALLVMLVADEAGLSDLTAAPTTLQPVDSLQHLMMNTFRETMALPDALDLQAQLCAAVPAIALSRTNLELSCSLIEQSLPAIAPGSATRD